MSVSVRTRPVLAVSLSVFLLAAGSAGAATPTPAPAWQVVSVSVPTALSAEAAKLDELQLRVENIGEGVTDGSTIVVTDTLPAGVTTSSSHFLGSVDGGTYWSCGPVGAGQEKIECSHSGVATPFAQLPPIAVPVQVGSVAPGSVLTNDVSVEGGGAARVESSSPVLVEPTVPTPFGLAEGFKSYPTDPTGAFETQAAGHASSYNTSFDLNTVFSRAEGGEEQEIPVDNVKDIVVDLPVGFVGDPEALPRCPQALLASNRGESVSNCPANTRVGIVTWFGKGDYHESESIYNLVPGPDEPAVFGFEFAGQRILMHASVRTGSDYGVRVGIPGAPTIVHFAGAEVTFFGNPALEDGEAPPGKMFFTNPSDCSGEPLRTIIHTDSWEDPAQVPLNPDGSLDLNAANFSEPQWHTSVYESPAVTGCEALSFDPSFSLQPTSAETDSPSGATVDLHIPQENITEPETLPSPDLKKAVVTLPEGLVVDPSAADGLQACSEAQIALQSTYAPTCPEASKLGSVEVITPLLEHPLTGGVYLAREVENPFGSLIALYVVVEGAGVVVKVPGKVETDPLTGRLTATFDNNPQLPFEDFKLDFKDGPRASLTTPSTCGVKSTETMLTPYSAPQSGPPAASSSPFDLVSGPNGSGCVNSLSEEPDTPGFFAGTLEPQAGAYSPFVLKLTREDGSQIFKGLDVSLPPGLLGRIAGVEECSQAGIEAAEHRDRLGEGALEQAGPSCPAGSEVGTVTVGAGSGAPLYVGGHAYLAGPYKGAPFSLVIVTPAVAGPFDLGVVVVRSALYIDPETAQVTVKSDPIPTILDGIPLDIRSIMVDISRSGFTLNPTNCAPMAIAATAIAQSSQAGLSDRFQVGDCPSLPFAPSFAASTSGRTSKADGASLSVSVAQKPGEANIHKVDVQLPLVLPARLTTLQKACTEAQFDANPAGCPEASDIGTATAVTPLLSVPLTGPAYLVSHGGAAFPDVEFVLQGDNVLIDLDGKTDIKKGITYSKFETVPDAPISSFVTSFPEGPHSALAANASLCATTKTVSVRRRVTIHVHGHTTHRTKTVKETVSGVPPSLAMPTTIVAQNGAQIAQNTKITVTGCPKAVSAKKTTRKTKADDKKR